MKKECVTRILVAIFAAALVAAPNCRGAGESFWFDGGVGIMGGHTTYQIGGTVSSQSESDTYHFPVSELMFPMDVAIMKLRGGAAIGERWKVGFSVTANLTSEPSNMEDSDWLEAGRLDIFSESDTEMTAAFLDLDVVFMAAQAGSVGLWVGAGVMLQALDYECRMIYQASPSGLYPEFTQPPLDPADDVTGLKAITYTIVYLIPYLELAADMSAGDAVSLSAALRLSPLVVAADEDVHLLREPPITAEGTYTGYAFIASLDGRFNLSGNWFAGGEVSLAYIQADGEQDNTQPGKRPHTTDAEVESQQFSAVALLGFGF